MTTATLNWKKAVIANVREFCELLSVSEAYFAMKLIQHEDDPVMVRMDGIMHRTTIRELAKSDLNILLAKDLEVAFMGGPAAKRKMFRGSLVNFVADRLLHAAKTHGIDAVSGLLEELIQRMS
ncbi:MAG: hypothetical protein AMXMBFR16_11180 [Candidatus Uhrbacteria bacterium]